MKSSFVILLLPAALAFSPGHHHYNKRSAFFGAAPYGSSNGTSVFGSSGLLTAPTGTAGQTIYSTVVITDGATTQTVLESSPAAISQAGASVPFPSSCAQATVTVTTNATVTVTVSGADSGTTVPTQAPLPVESGVSSPVESATASPVAASSSALLPSTASALTLAPIGAGSSSAVVAATSAAVEAGTSAPAASPSTAAAPAPVTSTNGKSPKRGIIVSGGDSGTTVKAFANTKVSWLGNWYSGPPPELTPDMGMDFVPQLYSPSSANDGSWGSNTKKGIAAGDKYFMSFGEPAHSGITPETAVTAWMTDMEPYAKQGVSLGAPGNLQNPADMVWLAKFLDLCDTAGCTIGFLCVHWFWTPGPNGQQDFKNAVNNVTTQAKGKPVWVDNFEANGNTTAQIEFLTAIIPWLEDNDLIARYGYLAMNRTSGGFLPETGDELSDLGKFYATF